MKVVHIMVGEYYTPFINSRDNLVNRPLFHLSYPYHHIFDLNPTTVLHHQDQSTYIFRAIKGDGGIKI
jgi:hypothetical protein